MRHHYLIIGTAIAMLAFCSCKNISHNGNLVGVGKVFKAGAGDYGIIYVNGLFALEGVRENSEMVVETNDGDSFANPASAVKSLRTIRFRTGPQVTGYLVDLSQSDSKAAKAYVERMPDLNKSAWDVKQTKVAETASLKSEAVAKVKDAIENVKNSAEPFTCKDGNCDIAGLGSNNSTKYQAAVAAKLLTYADSSEQPVEEGGHTNYQNLVAFATRMAKFQLENKATTRMVIDSASVKDGKLTSVKFIYNRDDGTSEEISCVECVAFED